MDSFDILEKLAIARKKKVETEVETDPKVAQERELIRRIQEEQDDKAMKILTRRYRNVISQQVKRSGLSNIIDVNTAQALGANALEYIVKNNYKPGSDNKPNSYITGSLYHHLKNKIMPQHMDFAARKSTELTQTTGYLSVATPFLERELGRPATPVELHSFIKDVMKKKASLPRIKRALILNRDELNGDTQVGGADSSAEYMTLMDIKSNTGISPEVQFNKMMSDNAKKQTIEAEISKYAPGERKFIRNYFGYGKFTGWATKNITDSMVNSGLDKLHATRIIREFNVFLHKHNYAEE